ILDEAIKRGYNVECYYRPLSPKKPQHIYLPEKKIIIVTTENHININYQEVFNLHSLMETEKIKMRISEIENNLHLYNLLTKNALEKLSSTKKMHDLLEDFYVNSMNFDGVNEIFDNIIKLY
ncbi:MAG: hypothetical protein GX339_06225, partial [Tissierellia bacterium]|nr:hypothetical protein [Tissierellia bacterium]